MKHIPYRQNPTVIDISKKARPPPGTSESKICNLYFISDHIDIIGVAAFSVNCSRVVSDFLWKYHW